MSFKNGPYHSVGQIIVPTKRIAPSPCAVEGHRTKIATFEIPSENNINRKTNSSRAIGYYLFFIKRKYIFVDYVLFCYSWNICCSRIFHSSAYYMEGQSKETGFFSGNDPHGSCFLH